MPKHLDFKNLRKCIDNYVADEIYIRLVGSMGGTTKLEENLKNKKLDFKKDKSGLYILINKEEKFHFPLENYYKGFSLAYERFEKDGRVVMLSTNLNPNDSSLPEPSRSFLRTVMDNHLMEIYFKGKIPIKPYNGKPKETYQQWMIA